jgi:hypothetical protein
MLRGHQAGGTIGLRCDVEQNSRRCEMATNDQKDPTLREEGRDEPTGVENLFIGHFDEVDVIGHINGEIPCRFKGDLLIYRQPDSDVFKVEHLRRVALWGMPEPGRDTKPPLGVISMAGPVGDTEQVPADEEDVAYRGEVDLQLHYYSLSRPELLGETEEPGQRRVEWIRADLTLTTEFWNEPKGEASLQVDLDLPALVRGEVRQIQSIKFGRFPPLTFRLSRRQSENKVAPANSLSGCTAPTQPCTEPFNQTGVIHELRLKFINFSTEEDVSMAELIKRCQNQLDGACEVWGNRAAINLLPERDIDDAPPELKDCYSELGSGQQLDLPCDYAHFLKTNKPVCLENPCGGAPVDPYADFFEIYLVGKRAIKAPPNNHGGITHHDGQGSAYCILDVEAMSVNQYLLAHELGHVLGISHPYEQICPGSFFSVMLPGTPNSERNTRATCKILDPAFAGIGDPCFVPLNAKVTATDFHRNYCLHTEEPDGHP